MGKPQTSKARGIWPNAPPYDQIWPAALYVTWGKASAPVLSLQLHCTTACNATGVSLLAGTCLINPLKKHPNWAKTSGSLSISLWLVHKVPYNRSSLLCTVYSICMYSVYMHCICAGPPTLRLIHAPSLPAAGEDGHLHRRAVDHCERGWDHHRDQLLPWPPHHRPKHPGTEDCDLTAGNLARPTWQKLYWLTTPHHERVNSWS